MPPPPPRRSGPARSKTSAALPTKGADKPGEAERQQKSAGARDQPGVSAAVAAAAGKRPEQAGGSRSASLASELGRGERSSKSARTEAEVEHALRGPSEAERRAGVERARKRSVAINLSANQSWASRGVLSRANGRPGSPAPGGKSAPAEGQTGGRVEEERAAAEARVAALEAEVQHEKEAHGAARRAHREREEDLKRAAEESFSQLEHEKEEQLVAHQIAEEELRRQAELSYSELQSELWVVGTEAAELGLLYDAAQEQLAASVEELEAERAARAAERESQSASFSQSQTHSSALREQVGTLQASERRLIGELAKATRRLAEAEPWEGELAEARSQLGEARTLNASLRVDLKTAEARADRQLQALEERNLLLQQQLARRENATQASVEEAGEVHADLLRQSREQSRSLAAATALVTQLQLDVKDQKKRLGRADEREAAAAARLVTAEVRTEVALRELRALEEQWSLTRAAAVVHRDAAAAGDARSEEAWRLALEAKDEELAANAREAERLEAVLRGRLDWQTAATAEAHAKLRTYREALELSQTLRAVAERQATLTDAQALPRGGAAGGPPRPRSERRDEPLDEPLALSNHNHSNPPPRSPSQRSRKSESKSSVKSSAGRSQRSAVSRLFDL